MKGNSHTVYERKSAQDKRVALAILSQGYGFGLRKVQGIIDFFKKHHDWQILRNKWSQPFVLLEDLLGWDGHGVIGEIYTPEELEIVRALKIPFVNTCTSDLASDLPSVSFDNAAVGRMAAEHLLECKPAGFAFVGSTGFRYVRERYEGFNQALEAVGSTCEMVHYAPNVDIRRQIPDKMAMPEELLQQLKGLEYPVGIMAADDHTGFFVMEAIRMLGLRSPEDIAVIGVDNDELYCNLAHVAMTSIASNARDVGFVAADMLDRMMNGEVIEQPKVLIQPLKIMLRNSTDVIRSEYPEVTRAMSFIRNHADKFIDVSDVLEVVPFSRRWLEAKFKAEVGHGIYHEIRRVHVECAKELLLGTVLPVPRIALESGFLNAESLESAFRKFTGMSASEFRQTQAEA